MTFGIELLNVEVTQNAITQLVEHKLFFNKQITSAPGTFDFASFNIKGFSNGSNIYDMTKVNLLDGWLIITAQQVTRIEIYSKSSNDTSFMLEWAGEVGVYSGTLPIETPIDLPIDPITSPIDGDTTNPISGSSLMSFLPLIAIGGILLMAFMGRK